MINRLTEYFGAPGVPPPKDYWFVYRREGGGWAVTLETAETIAGVLGRKFPPRWVTFSDVTGGTVRVTTRSIVALEESSKTQRALSRAFWQGVQEEGEDPTACL